MTEFWINISSWEVSAVALSPVLLALLCSSVTPAWFPLLIKVSREKERGQTLRALQENTGRMKGLWFFLKGRLSPPGCPHPVSPTSGSWRWDGSPRANIPCDLLLLLLAGTERCHGQGMLWDCDEMEICIHQNQRWAISNLSSAPGQMWMRFGMIIQWVSSKWAFLKYPGFFFFF